MRFRSVIMQNQPEIAKVNRKTGVLYLNSKIWDSLPTDQKEFVLFHEAGHLRLQTNSEFQANKYAVGKFAPARTFNNRKLGQKICVMREILGKADDNLESGFAFGDLISGTFKTLSILGVGSKARRKETAANAAANAAVTAANVKMLEAKMISNEQKSESVTKAIIVSGIVIFVLVATVLILKK